MVVSDPVVVSAAQVGEFIPLNTQVEAKEVPREATRQECKQVPREVCADVTRTGKMTTCR